MPFHDIRPRFAPVDAAAYDRIVAQWKKAAWLPPPTCTCGRVHLDGDRFCSRCGVQIPYLLNALNEGRRQWMDDNGDC